MEHEAWFAGKTAARKNTTLMHSVVHLEACVMSSFRKVQTVTRIRSAWLIDLPVSPDPHLPTCVCSCAFCASDANSASLTSAPRVSRSSSAPGDPGSAPSAVKQALM